MRQVGAQDRAGLRQPCLHGSRARRGRDRSILKRLPLDGLETDLDQPTYNGNRIEGRVRIDERAFVQASVIVGPSVIGPGAHGGDA